MRSILSSTILKLSSQCSSSSSGRSPYDLITFLVPSSWVVNDVSNLGLYLSGITGSVLPTVSQAFPLFDAAGLSPLAWRLWRSILSVGNKCFLTPLLTFVLASSLVARRPYSVFWPFPRFISSLQFPFPKVTFTNLFELVQHFFCSIVPDPVILVGFLDVVFYFSKDMLLSDSFSDQVLYV